MGSVVIFAVFCGGGCGRAGKTIIARLNYLFADLELFDFVVGIHQPVNPCEGKTVKCRAGCGRFASSVWREGKL